MNYVIIGGSAAGISCAESIRSIDKKSKITIISDEEYPLYSKSLLTYLISGKIQKEDLKFKEEDFYERFNIEALLGKRAESLDLQKKEVVLEDKKRIGFDKLLIATGASPKKLNIPGEKLKGVFGLRTIKDAEAIISMLGNIKRAVILGGGLIGLRDAYALNARGKQVSVVVKSPQVLSQMLDSEGAGIIERKLVENGIEVAKGLSATKILGKNKVEGILLDNKEKLACEVVIIGKGVAPNIDIVKETDIKVNRGILVDGNLKTSHEDVYAAGDVAETYDLARDQTAINAIWPAAVEQGKIAGLNMAGQKREYGGSMSMNSIEFFDLPAISMGITKSKKEGYDEIKMSDSLAPAHRGGVYKKIVLKDDIIRGMVLIGKVENAGVIGVLAKKKINVKDIKEDILKDNFDYAKILPLVKERSDRFKEDEFQDTVLGLPGGIICQG